jgi:hypothetical protein
MQAALARYCPGGLAAMKSGQASMGRSRSTTLGGIRRRQPSVPIWNRRHRGGAHRPTWRYLSPRARWERSAGSYLLPPVPWVAAWTGPGASRYCAAYQHNKHFVSKCKIYRSELSLPR